MTSYYLIHANGALTRCGAAGLKHSKLGVLLNALGTNFVVPKVKKADLDIFLYVDEIRVSVMSEIGIFSYLVSISSGDSTTWSGIFFNLDSSSSRGGDGCLDVGALSD